MKYKYIQRAKMLITYPIRLLLLPLWFVTGFLGTNWEKEWDRHYFWEQMSSMYKPW